MTEFYPNIPPDSSDKFNNFSREISLLLIGIPNESDRLPAEPNPFMQIQRHKLLKIAATGATGLAFAGAVQAATTLMGDGQANNEQVPSDHGSNAPGTPNITLAWDEAWDSYSGWPKDPGDGVYQHDNGAGVPHTILFSPDSGWNVSLVGLDVNVWAGGGPTDLDWSVTGSVSGELGSGTFNSPNDSVINYPLEINGVGGENLTLSLIQQTGSSSYLAIDNLTFDQVAIPETSSIAFAALGIGAAGMRRRRRSRA